MQAISVRKRYGETPAVRGASFDVRFRLRNGVGEVLA